MVNRKPREEVATVAEVRLSGCDCESLVVSWPEDEEAQSDSRKGLWFRGLGLIGLIGHI